MHMETMETKAAERVALVEKRFTEFAASTNTVVGLLDPVKWEAMRAGVAGELGEFTEREGGEFGWSWPIYDDAQVSVAVCPRIIVGSTMTLDDEDFDNYLDAIEFMISLDIGLCDEIPDWEERRRAVHKFVIDHFPGTTSMIADVEIAMTLARPA